MKDCANCELYSICNNYNCIEPYDAECEKGDNYNVDNTQIKAKKN